MHSVQIAAPAETVWAILVDVERWPEWTRSMDSVERVDDGPFEVGSTVKVKQPRLPAVEWTVTALEPGRAFTWQARGPGVTSLGVHRIDPADGTVTVTLGIDQSGPLAWLGSLLLGRLTRRYVAMEAEGLRAKAEANASA